MMIERQAVGLIYPKTPVRRASDLINFYSGDAHVCRA